MIIAITGGAGFIGTAVINALKKDSNSKLRALVYKRRININGIDIIDGNINEERPMGDLLKNADILIHLAGYFSKDVFESNVATTWSLLNGCIKYNVKKIIYASSIAVYGETKEGGASESDDPKPRTLYGFSKFIAETIIKFHCEKYGISATILRLANIYGPGNQKGVVYNLVNNIVKNKEIVINRDGTQKRDFLFIEDVAQAMVNAMQYLNKGYQVFNVSSETGVAINDLVKMIEKKTEEKAKISYNPDISDEDCLIAKNMKAKSHLDFAVKTALDQGLDAVIEWVKKNGQE